MSGDTVVSGVTAIGIQHVGRQSIADCWKNLVAPPVRTMLVIYDATVTQGGASKKIGLKNNTVLKAGALDETEFCELYESNLGYDDYDAIVGGTLDRGQPRKMIRNTTIDMSRGPVITVYQGSGKLKCKVAAAQGEPFGDSTVVHLEASPEMLRCGATEELVNKHVFALEELKGEYRLKKVSSADELGRVSRGTGRIESSIVLSLLKSTTL